MKEKAVSNPYRDQSRGDLYDAAQRRAGELMNPTGTRSPEERAALALNTAHLLLALAPHVSSGEYTAGTPLNTLRAGQVGLRDAFAVEYAKMTRHVRYIIFMQAADAAAGGGVPSWIARDRVGADLYEDAMRDETGLFAALDKMQAIYEAGRQNKG